MYRRLLTFVVTAFLGACTTSDPEPVTLPTCALIDPAAHPTVAGVFGYESLLYPLSGTITFEQTANTVRVTDTTYDQADDRALQGESTLGGNELDVVLTPKNGDTDYSARVRLSFTGDGNQFCLLSFSDTNDDVGGEGTYTGTKIQTP